MIINHKSNYIIKLFILLVLAGILSSCSIFFKQKGPEITTDKDVKKEKKELEFKYAFIEGNKQKMLGNYNKSVAYFSKCLKLNNKSAAARYELANLYILQKDVPTAISLMQEATDIKPDNVWYKLLLAALYEKNNDLDEAISVYKDLIKENPKRTDLYIDYAGLLTVAEEYRKALDVYENFEENYGLSEEILMQKEKLLLKMGKTKEAYQLLENLIALNPDEARYYGLLAETYIANKELEKAKQVYDRLLEVDPTNGLAHFSLSEYYRITGDEEKSYEALKIAFASENVNLDLKLKKLISYYFNSNDINDKNINSKSFELLDILTKTHSNAKVYTVYGDILINKKKYSEAREKYLKALEISKNNYSVWEQLLYIETKLNSYSAMLKESTEAIKYYPNRPKLYLFKGISAYRKQKFNIAVEALETGLPLIVSDDQMESQFHTYLGESYHALDKYEEAYTSLDKALEFNPKDKFVLNNYSYYLSERGVNLDKAEKMAQKCVELEENSSTYLDTYAWALYKNKKYKKALEIIKKSITNGGDNSAIIIEHYGDILYKNGNKEEALVKWVEANTIGKGSDLLEEKIKQKKLVE